MRIVFSLALLFVLLFHAGCKRLGGRSFVPVIEGYNDADRKQVLLGKKLREISGIDYISPTQLVAINDEVGKIFLVNPLTGKQQNFSWGKKGDYEEVVVAGDYFYVLRSDGHLFKINRSDYELVAEFSHDFGKHIEFESMFHDKATGHLVLICKECCRNCATISAFRFDLAQEKFLPDTYFSIAWKDIRKMAKNNQIECKPSAAALHPLTNKLFIIASVGKVLLECSREGVLEKVHTINPYHFQQPEGLTFAPDGTLYIANESVQGKATLIHFPYKR